MGKWVQLRAAQSAIETEKAMKASLELQRQEAARRARSEAADPARSHERTQQGEAEQRVTLLESRVAGLEARVQLLTEQLQARLGD